MTDTAAQIRALLIELRHTLSVIQGLRAELDRHSATLALFERDLAQRLAPTYAESERLRAERDGLRARLQPTLARPAAPASPPVAVAPRPAPAATITLPAFVPGPDGELRDRRQRKEALADHIYDMLDDEQAEETMAQINAVVVDDALDVGHILEGLAWGPIWELPSPHEHSPAQQARRLSIWQATLRERLAYWQEAVLAADRAAGKGLLAEMRARSRSQWLAYLDGLALEQERENDRLRREIQVLAERLRRLQPEGD